MAEKKESISQNPEISTQAPKSNTTVPSATAQIPTAKSEAETQQEQTTPKYQSIQIAKQHNIEVPLMLAIIHAESNFNPIAVSKNGRRRIDADDAETARELGLTVPKYQDKRKPNLDSYIDERFDSTQKFARRFNLFQYAFREI